MFGLSGHITDMISTLKANKELLPRKKRIFDKDHTSNLRISVKNYR